MGRVQHFRRRRLSPAEGKAAAERILATPLKERGERATELSLDSPETMLALLAYLIELGPRSPEKVLVEAEFLHGFLQGLEVRYPVDPILHDEREYFLGEAARIAGTMCRELSRREEARDWFDRAEGWYIHTENCAGNLLKLRYQRLALRVEEREFASVLELVPQVIWGFEKVGMPHDALKARSLQAVALKESGQMAEALKALGRIVEEAETLRNESLLGSAYVNRSQIHAFLGEAEEAVAQANLAMPILRSLGHQIDLAKLQWGLGYLLRSQGKTAEAIEVFRASQRAFMEIGLRGDVAAVHLVVADLLLDAGQEAQAEWEIRAALPVIDELRLVPEGVAALSLLRESMRGRRIDRKALRDLHGYFPES